MQDLRPVTANPPVTAATSPDTPSLTPATQAGLRDQKMMILLPTGFRVWIRCGCDRGLPNISAAQPLRGYGFALLPKEMFF